MKYGVLASAALALPFERVVRAKTASDRISVSKFPKPYTVPFAVPPEAVPTKRSSTTDYYTVTMRSAMTEILPGLKTETWSYDGSFGGPTIRATRGRPAVVRHVNAPPRVHPRLGYESWTSVHLHGSASLPEYDGYAVSLIVRDAMFDRDGQLLYDDVRMTFHVPNEKPSARTVAVRIEAPEGVRGLRAEQVTGWTAEPAAAGDGGRTAAWSGGEIGGEDEADFVVHIDHLPTGVSELAFVARQEYDDGEVVTWDQKTEAGQPEPEHPATVLNLTGAPAADAVAHSANAPDASWTAAVVCGVLLLLAAAGLPVARSAARRRGAATP